MHAYIHAYIGYLQTLPLYIIGDLQYQLDGALERLEELNSKPRRRSTQVLASACFCRFAMMQRHSMCFNLEARFLWGVQPLLL